MQIVRDRSIAACGAVMMLLTLGGCAPSPVATTPQEIIIDNRDSQVTIVAGEWATAAADNGHGAYGPDFLYHEANRTDVARVHFTPTIEQAGDYTVSIYWSAAADRTTDQPVIVHAADGDTTYHVNLQEHGNQWFELGAHAFGAGTGGYIEINTDTDAGFCNADAVRLVQVVSQ